MKKRILSLILVLLLILQVIPAKADGGFTDTRGHWAEAYIAHCADQGYLKGYPDGSFKPDRPISKAEYYTITNYRTQATQANVKKFAKTTPAYKDVKKGDWFFDQVQAGIQSGYLSNDDENLNPNEPITREDAMRIFAHVQRWDQDPKASDRFTDRGQISDSCKGGVGASVKNNIINGYPDGSFRPQGSLTRAEAATIIAKFEGAKPKPSGGQWHWSFANTSANFANGYMLNDREKDLIQSKFSETDIARIIEGEYETWGGSCYGFATTAALYKTGLLEIKGLNEPDKGAIGELQAQGNYKSQSRINAYQLSQASRSIQNVWIDKGLGWKTEFTKDDTDNLGVFAERLKAQLDEVKAQGSAVVFCFWIDVGGHAIVAYDYEALGTMLKVKTYDCNDPNNLGGDIFTIDLASGTASYVGGLNADGSPVLNDVEGILSVKIKDLNQAASIQSKGLTLNVQDGLNKSLNLSVGGKSFNLNKDYKNKVKGLDSKEVTYFIEDASGPISLQGQEDLKLTISQGPDLYHVETDKFDLLTIDGKDMAIKGQKGKIGLSLVTDENIQGFKWSGVNLQGSDSGDIKVTRGSGGFDIEGSNLKGSVISAQKGFSREGYTIGADSRLIQVRESNEKLTLIDEEGRRYDENYLKPKEGDPVGGSWQGSGTYLVIDKVYPTFIYAYIENVGGNNYILVNRSVLQDDLNSEFFAKQKARFDPAQGTLVVEESTEVYGETGFFKGMKSQLNAGTFYLTNQGGRLSWDQPNNSQAYYDKY